jgi:hypothetical protein
MTTHHRRADRSGAYVRPADRRALMLAAYVVVSAVASAAASTLLAIAMRCGA